MKGRVLILPSVRKGDGLGHLKRSCALAEQLGTSAVLNIPESSRAVRELVKSCSAECIWGPPPDKGRWDLAVLDQRNSDKTLIFRLLDRGIPVVGIDEGGSSRTYCSYLIDMLPFPDSWSLPNIYAPGFLDLPVRKPMKQGEICSVLVTFGGEDPFRLTEKAIGFFIRRGFFDPSMMTAVLGPLFSSQTIPSNVNVLDKPGNLKELLPRYDLVVTSFGLTAYEAAASGVPVLILNPGRYHQKLTSLSGFPGIGVLKPNERKVRKFLGDPDLLRRRSVVPVPEKNESLKDRINRIRTHPFPGCRVCGKKINPAIGRFPEKTYFRCSHCGTVYMERFSKEKGYGRDYFFSDYRKQYGRTYLEDFEHIREQGRRRVRAIKEILPVSGNGKARTLLDIGCAYGPFLSAAHEEGFAVFGIDVSEPAVRFVRSELGFSGCSVSLEDFEPASMCNRGTFDVVTLWYVAEHIERLGAMLEKISGFLHKGGVLALATPNGKGISGRTGWTDFLRDSPDDHYTVWTPGWTKKVLRKYGFSLRKVIHAGHHPERFPCRRIARRRGGYALLSVISRTFRLGDTFEVYAVKQDG